MTTSVTNPLPAKVQAILIQLREIQIEFDARRAAKRFRTKAEDNAWFAAIPHGDWVILWDEFVHYNFLKMGETNVTQVFCSDEKKAFAWIEEHGEIVSRRRDRKDNLFLHVKSNVGGDLDVLFKRFVR